jgi:SAM-dependent methyltransferase
MVEAVHIVSKSNGTDRSQLSRPTHCPETLVSLGDSLRRRSEGSDTLNAVVYHAQLAGAWEKQYQEPAFQARLLVLEKCLPDDLQRQEWLDAGCGPGTLTRWLAGRGCHVLGVDAAEDMIAVARKLSTGSKLIEFERIETIADLPFSNESRDGILCSSVLEYLPDPERCLAEFARVLRSDGRLIVTVPNRNSLIRRGHKLLRRAGRLVGRQWFKYLAYSHNDYIARDFGELLKDFGFLTNRMIPFGVWGESLLAFCCTRKSSGSSHSLADPCERSLSRGH